MSKKREYCVGIKINNCFYVEAENRDEAEHIVREYDPYKTLDDCDFNIEYVLIESETGEILWPLLGSGVLLWLQAVPSCLQSFWIVEMSLLKL